MTTTDQSGPLADFDPLADLDVFAVLAHIQEQLDTLTDTQVSVLGRGDQTAARIRALTGAVTTWRDEAAQRIRDLEAAVELLRARCAHLEATLAEHRPGD
jgi:hypothetical protein